MKEQKFGRKLFFIFVSFVILFNFTVASAIGKVIFVDTGHGLADPGAVKDGLKEYDFNKQIVEAIVEYLKFQGLTVIDPWSEGVYDEDIYKWRTEKVVPAEIRAKAIRRYCRWKKIKDYEIISIHNDVKAITARGQHTYSWNSPDFAKTIQKYLTDSVNPFYPKGTVKELDGVTNGISHFITKGAVTDSKRYWDAMEKIIERKGYEGKPVWKKWVPESPHASNGVLIEVANMANSQDLALLQNPSFIKAAGYDIGNGELYYSGYPIITAYDKTGINPCHIDGEKVVAYLDFDVADSQGIKEVKIDDKVMESDGTPKEASFTAEIIGEGDHYITVTDVDSDTHTSRLKVKLILEAQDCRFVIGNDHPDETESVSTYVPETGEVRSYANPVIVMMWGSAGHAYRMIRSVTKEETLGFLLDFYPVLLARDHPLLVIPSGGLYGMDSAASFRKQLADYVQNGGTLICFTQQHGYEFSALPGGGVSGYGWNEDQSCHTNAAYIDTYHPMFAGQENANLDANVDGYFTNWPDNATILLRRTKNGMPAMVAYPYGLGWVVVSTLYSDWSYAHGGITPNETALIHDLISWAKNPDKEIKEYKPAETVSISIPVTNYSSNSSNSILLTLLNPDKKVMSTTEVVHPLNPGESTEIPFTCMATWPLGIWWVNYALKDFSGNIIQPETEGERFQVGYHYESPKSPDISFSISAPSEFFSKGSEGIFTFHIWNHGETDRDLTVKYHFPHHYQQTGDPIYGVKSYSLSNSVHVVAGSEASFVYVVPIVTNDQLFSKIYDEDGDEIGYSNFKIWALDPLVSTKIQTDKIEYSPGENVNVSLSMQNLQQVVCDATVKLRVLDPDNVIIFEKDIYLHLEENGSVVETASFTLSADSKKGQYVIRVETESGGDIIDSACCYFEIPMATLSIIANVPEIFSLINPISFIVSNVGEVNVSDGELQVSLEDPDKSSAWNETREFALPAGQSINFDFLASLSEVKLGNYRLINRITTEGRPTSNGSIALPCSASTQISFDKLLYKTREPLSLNLEVTNTGKFEEPLEIISNIPTCNFTQSQKVTILPDQSINIPYNLTIPDTAPAGTNSVEVMLKMANTLIRTFNFAILSSKLVLSLDKLEYALGESGEIRIENQGGVDTDYDYTIKIVDLKGVVVSEESGTGSIQWGSSQTIGFSLASSQIVDGEYLLSCLVNEEKLNKKTLFERYIKVTGLTASLVASTDKKTYFKGEPVEASAKITPSGGTISDGSLNLKIYSPEEKWAEYPDLKGTTYIVAEDGIVWFGTVSGELIKYDKAKGVWATYNLPSDGIYGNYVYCLAVDVNYVWVGTRSGLMRWDKAGESWKVYTPAQGLSNITVISLANDGNYLWVGTGWGLNRMDKINETFQHYITSDGLVDNQVRSIAVDGNFIWIGTLNGVSRFNKADSSWQTFTKTDGLVDNKVRAIAVEESYVWFATQGGVSRFEKGTNSWKTFTVSDGLVSNDVYSIGLDGTYIWFGTYEGLSRFYRVDNSWKTFTTQDGLAGNFVRIIVLDGYEIWFIAGEIS